jgi:hypothetical protein
MAFSLGNEHETFIEFPNATHARVYVTERSKGTVNVRDSSTADPATLDIFLRVNGSG